MPSIAPIAQIPNMFAPAPTIAEMTKAINHKMTPAAIIEVGEFLLNIFFTMHQSFLSGKLLRTVNW
jgi:hypothetical protein